jgi:acetylornithine deacetylase/succinyl-diaminopimelate desuccinylase-like protein
VDSALTKIYGKRLLQIGAGGSVGPLVDIKEKSGIYAYSFGFQQQDEKWHSANEFFRLSSIRKGILIYCYYLQLIADAEKYQTKCYPLEKHNPLI